MAILSVDNSKCISCGICEKSCKFQGVKIENKYPIFNDNCTFCFECITACPTSAITVLGLEKKEFDTTLWSGVMVYLEIKDNILSEVSKELIGKARELANTLSEKVFGVVINHNINLEELKTCGVDTVFVAEGEQFADFKLDLVGDCLHSIIEKVKPSIFLVGATNQGKTIVPYISVKCETGMTADCTSLEIDKNGNLIQIRPAFGGNIMAEILTENSRPQIATVREKIFKITVDVKTQAEIVKVQGLEVVSKYDVLKIVKKAVDSDISHAKILIAIGNGVKKKEEIAVFQKLADEIGGELCSSRALVEAGLMPQSRQVGLSGKAVSADLMFAFGISGSAQFLAGVGGVKTLIAINADPDANIMTIANHGIVADIFQTSAEVLLSLRKK